MAQLASWFNHAHGLSLGRPVIDKTGLTGFYTFTLYWVPDEGPNPDQGAAILATLQDQAGLKLESRRGPVDYIVVDHAEKVPVGN